MAGERTRTCPGCVPAPEGVRQRVGYYRGAILARVVTTDEDLTR